MLKAQDVGRTLGVSRECEFDAKFKNYKEIAHSSLSATSEGPSSADVCPSLKALYRMRRGSRSETGNFDAGTDLIHLVLRSSCAVAR